MSLFSISFMLSGLCASASEGLSDVLSSGISQEISAGGTESGGILAVQYLFYFLIIILGIVFLTLFRRRVSRGLTCAAVKEKCLTLKKLLEETLDSSGRKKKKSVKNPARMAILRSAAEEAMWSASRLVDERRNLLFDGITENLDQIANLFAAAEGTFASEEETEKIVREALEKTEAVLAKIDAAMPESNELDK